MWFFSSKNEHNFLGGVWASVTKHYMGVGGLLKHPLKAWRNLWMALTMYTPWVMNMSMSHDHEGNAWPWSCPCPWPSSVPARLGKGQGAKEIGHNLARERPTFGHNLVRKLHKIGHKWASEAHFYAWTTKVRSQSSTRMKRGLGTILRAIDENMGTNLQAVTSIFTSENTKTAITFYK